MGGKDKSINYDNMLKTISEIYKRNNQAHDHLKQLEDNELYLSYTPTNESLMKKMTEIEGMGQSALTEAKIAIQRANDALDGAKKAQDKAETLKWWVIALIVVLVIEFLWWLYTAIIRVQNTIDNFNERAIPLEKKITEFEMKSGKINDDISSLRDYVDNKIESEIDKAMLEFYKSQWVLKK